MSRYIGFCIRNYACHIGKTQSPLLGLSIVNQSRQRKKGLAGYDAGKKVKGRKRHILVDTLGFPIELLITPGHVSDKEGFKLIYERINRRPQVIFADEGYTSQELAELYAKQGTRIEIVKKDKSKGIKDEKRGFAIGPKRWIVERTFAWIGKFRRFSKDYELVLTSSRALILMALGKLILGRFSSGI